MIQTIRDAEVKIGILEKDNSFLKNKIRTLENELDSQRAQIADLRTMINRPTIIPDWYPNPDGTIITHQSIHSFDKIKVNEINGVPV